MIESGAALLSIEVLEVLRELFEDLGLAGREERRQLIACVLTEIPGESPDRVEAGNAAKRREEGVPVAALRQENLAASGRESVVAATSLTRLLDPFAFDPVAPFHAVEHWIQRRDVKPKLPTRTVIDQLADLVAMPLAFLETRKNH